MAHPRAWGVAAVLLGAAGWLLGPGETRGDSGLGSPPGKILSVMAATGTGTQALVVVDTGSRKVAVYTVENGRIVFAALRPYLYDLAVPEEYPQGPARPNPSWQQMQEALENFHKKAFAAFRKADPKGTFEAFLDREALDGAREEFQISTASDSAVNQPQLIELLDVVHRRLVIYRFTTAGGLQLVAARNLAWDLKARDRVQAPPGYIPVKDVRDGVEKAAGK